MRADRLIAEISLLQTRGRMSATQLAEELEVSPRTIYRDMTALSTAGVPVFTSMGAEGGFELVEGYRTSLTGLTREELRALFSLDLPAALEDLGLSGPFQSAMRKFLASLSSEQSQHSGWARQRILIDPDPWQPARQDGQPQRELLGCIQSAVWEDRLLTLSITTFPHFLSLEDLQVEPHSLALKGGTWHLIARRKGRWHIYPLAIVRAARLEPQGFSRDPGLDPRAVWQRYCKALEKNRGNYRVHLRCREDILPYLRHDLGESLQEEGLPDPEPGWVQARLAFDDFHDAQKQLLYWGASLEVISPQPLRSRLLDHARQLVNRYSPSPEP